MSEPAKASSGTREPRDHSHHSVDGRALSNHSAASDGHTFTPSRALDDHHAHSHHSDTVGGNGHTHSGLPFDGRIHTYIPDMDEDRIYMDYNATTPLEPQVIQAVTEALHEAWGNPSSTYTPGVKAKKIITQARENVARMVGGKADDIIFTSGGTEANNLVFRSALEAYRESCRAAERRGESHHHDNGSTSAWPLPHILVSNVEHDSVRLTTEHLLKDATADVTSVAVSKVTGRVEVEDVLAAVRSSTCLISIMMANNETGVLMPIRELCQRIRFVNRQRQHRILLHTDAAQAIGKVRVDALDLGVDYLTIVGHKFYAPRIGALYVNGPGTTTPLYPMLFGGGQERNFRPGTENTPMIAGLGKAAELVNSNLTEYETHMLDTRDYLEERLEAVFGRERIHFNSHFPDSETLPNTCNVSVLGPGLQGRKVLSSCRRLLASVGAACHSHRGDRPSHILLSCGIPEEVAANALRLSVGRSTSRAEVGLVVDDLKNAVETLQGLN
ncbi:selenocysteine lyase [Coregonus clupeaformis]|uniref:selenocysteine lyase n=1 Tax=Coregonus clupeaformis TaxID=59861 RepID=UPI001BDFCDEA|nr:selenocysteine lyase [Coregonus clupeaformis]